MGQDLCHGRPRHPRQGRRGMTPDLERAIKAGCEAHECVYPTCIGSDGTLCRQHQRYLLAALAALDPPSDVVVEGLARLRCDRNGYKQITAREREHTAEDIRAYLAAIRGEK